MVWEPKNGCCCCSTPRTATLILGWMGVIGAGIAIISAARMAALPRELLVQRCRDFEQIWHMGNGSEASCYETSVAGMSMSVVEQLAQGTLSVLLLVGVKKRNQCLMMPYMIMQVLGIIAFGIGFLVMAIISLVFQQLLIAFITVLAGGLMTFLGTYLFLVVRVCYKEVKAQQVTTDNDIEVGFMNNQEPSHSFKNIIDSQSSAPPAYSRLDRQESLPPPYEKLDSHPSAPPPYSV